MSSVLALLLPLVQWFLTLIFGPKPDSVAVEAEKAGSATATVIALEKSNVQTEASVNAWHAISRSVSGDSGLHNYEAADPNNRDNGG